MSSKTFLDSGERVKALEKVVWLLLGAEDVLVLAHKAPDGDTLGSASALARALIKLGKTAHVICDDPFPQKYNYLFEGLRSAYSRTSDLTSTLIVATDIATVELMGESLAPFSDKVGLCIDHHPSNTGYADFTLVDPTAAATCEIVAEIIDLLGVEIDSDIANCIYTGLATDTGCFRFSNTTPKTLRTAATMIEKGADSVRLNKLLFETKSRGRLEMERMALETLEYYFGGLVAMITLTIAMNKTAGISDSQTEGIASIPVRIEGVEVGITLKERENGFYKISLRTSGKFNASDICASLGGGGHAAAAGCRVEGSLDEVKRKILTAVNVEMGKHAMKGEDK